MAVKSQPPLAHSTRSKGKNVSQDSLDESSSATPTIPSGPRAIDEGTPVYPTVEDANDQLRRSEGIRNPSNRTTPQRNHGLPETLEAALQEIAALKAANEELRHPVTPGKRRDQKPKSRSHRNRHQNRQTSGLASSHSGTRSEDL
jgi:hypothetical protein